MSSQVKSSGVDWVFYLGSLKAKIKMPARLGSPLGRINFRFIQVIGRIPFPEAVGQGLLFPWWLSAQSLSLSSSRPLAFVHTWPHPSSSQQQHTKSFLSFRSLCFPILL